MIRECPYEKSFNVKLRELNYFSNERKRNKDRYSK